MARCEQERAIVCNARSWLSRSRSKNSHVRLCNPPASFSTLFTPSPLPSSSCSLSFLPPAPSLVRPPSDPAFKVVWAVTHLYSQVVSQPLNSQTHLSISSSGLSDSLVAVAISGQIPERNWGIDHDPLVACLPRPCRRSRLIHPPPLPVYKSSFRTPQHLPPLDYPRSPPPNVRQFFALFVSV